MRVLVPCAVVAGLFASAVSAGGGGSASASVAAPTPTPVVVSGEVSPASLLATPTAVVLPSAVPSPAVLVEFTPAPQPTDFPPAPPLVIPLAPEPEQAVEANPSCTVFPPDWVTAPTGQMLANGWTLEQAQTYIWHAWQDHACLGSVGVRIAGCEGLNAVANWDPSFINFADSVGVFQINWVHGQPGGIIEGRFPELVQTVEGNTAVALMLYDVALADPVRGDPLGDWRPWSGHCWDR